MSKSSTASFKIMLLLKTSTSFTSFSYSVKLEGCIVCNNVKIMEKCVLKDCEVAAKVVVEASTLGKNESLTL